MTTLTAPTDTLPEKPLRFYNVLLPWAWNGDADDEEGTYSTSLWAASEEEAKIAAATEMADSGEKSFDDDEGEDRQRYIDTRVEGWGETTDVSNRVAHDLAQLFAADLFPDGSARVIDMSKLRQILVANAVNLFEEVPPRPATSLEEALLEARARTRPAQTPRERQSEAMAIGREAFDGLVEYYPSVLTAERRTHIILAAVRRIESREQHGGAKLSYETLKDEIESEAIRAQAHLSDWRDLAEVACDDLLAYYPQVLTDAGRGEFIERALAQLPSGRLVADITDREECCARLKEIIGRDAAQRHVGRPQSPAN